MMFRTFRFAPPRISDAIQPLLNFAALNAVAMNPTSLATALIGAQTGMIELAVAGRLARMDNANNAASIAQLLDAADRSANSLANVAASTGTNLDISA